MEIKSKTSSTFCSLPWTHLHVSVTGQVQLCCVSKSLGHIWQNDLETIWNGDQIKRIRLQLLNNEKPKECSNCFFKEDVLKQESLRKSDLVKRYNEIVEPEKITLEDGTCTEMKLRYVDFRFSNLCNFKCRMCDGTFSSSIASEINLIREKLKRPNFGINRGKIDSSNIMYQEFKKQYKNVIEIYFAGGEPIMQKEHFMVLKDLIDLGRAGEITLQYSTNGSKFRNSLGNMFEYWKKFKHVNIIFSIDAFREQAEYWRHGGKWEDIEKNMRECLQYNNIKTSVHSTLGWPNILSWVEFVRYAYDNNLTTTILHRFSATAIDEPKCFRLTAIPPWKKKQISDKLDELYRYIENSLPEHSSNKNIGLMNTILAMRNALYINDEIIDKKEFYDQIDILDSHRGESFFKVFPEHLDLKSYLYE